jgi:hypothetical protein
LVSQALWLVVPAELFCLDQSDVVRAAPLWDQVSRIQAELLRASVQRAAEFTRRYFEVVQAVTASAVSTAQEQARKAA